MSLLQIHEPGQTPAPHEGEKSLAIGIDLGTTHSVVAHSRDQEVEVIRDTHGDAIIPSVVAYGDTTMVGRDAKEQGDAIHSIKRLMHEAAKMLQTPKGELSPVQISAEILKYVKAQAERALGQEVSQAVITVPAYFDDAARIATKDAARLAGLEVLRLINEPTAAALAYGLDHAAEGVFAIYDLGGGTFDISILKLEAGVFQVLATGGDTALGGDDFDDLIASQLNISKAEARSVKEQLSEAESVEVNGQSITREAFNELIAPLVGKTTRICESVMRDAGLEAAAIDGVVLVGGSTRVPYVREQVAECFGKQALTNIDPDQVVAVGAAIQAEALTQGANHLLLDVIPLSLGLETMGGLVEKVVDRNTPIPVSASQEFTTYQDGQSMMKIHVLQGEREMVDQCRSLAHFTLKDIPPLPANVARIKVTFTVDADGLLTVSAQETTTGTMQHIEVKPSYGLDIDQIEAMLRESMEHAQDDIMQRLLVESRVEAERLIVDLYAAIKADRALLEDEEKRQIDAQISRLQDAIGGDNREVIDYEAQRLSEISNSFAGRRMDKAISSALQGSHVDEFESEEVKENHA